MATTSGTPDPFGNLNSRRAKGSQHYNNAAVPENRGASQRDGTARSADSPPPDIAPVMHPETDMQSGPAKHGGTTFQSAAIRTPRRASPSQAGQQARRLITAANELLALAAELEDEATRGHLSVVPRAEEGPCPLDDDARWLRHARRLYRDRRSRGHVFGDESLFGEPGWDILVDLFIAAKERKRVPVTSACIGAAVPTTTALRWLAVLEDRGLVVREADESDARRIFVRLSTEAYAKMVSYFARAATAEADDTVEAVRAVGKALEQMRG